MTKKKVQKNTERYNILEIFWDRYNGLTNKSLSEKWKIPINTVAHYFAVNGKWNLKYKAYADELNKEAIDNAKRILRSGVEPASKVLLNKLKSDDEMVALRAAIEVLNRQFGKSVDVNANLNMDLSPLQEIAKRIKGEVLDAAEPANEEEAEPAVSKKDAG